MLASYHVRFFLCFFINTTHSTFVFATAHYARKKNAHNAQSDADADADADTDTGTVDK